MQRWKKTGERTGQTENKCKKRDVKIRERKKKKYELE
jgi:hypothetical protein